MEGNILQKIKRHGIAGSIQVVGLHAATAFNNKWFYYYKKHRPMDEHLIVMESEGDLSDNAFALYDYMRHNNYLKKYHVAWLVDHVDEARALQQKSPEDFPNTEFVQKVPHKVDKRWSEVLATCKWYIYDHCNLLATFAKDERQTIVYLSHGFGVKASKNLHPVRNNFDLNIVLGKIPAENAPLDWGGNYDQTRQWGYPRNDYLFQDNTSVENWINSKFHLKDYTRVFLWMPTFRQSQNKQLSEEYIKTETGLPLFTTINDLTSFNESLGRINALVILKVHHLQQNLPVFQNKFSNIRILKDEELVTSGIQLYQMIKYTDALITDYSSISTDYMLLFRPIIYVLDDYEEYQKARGLSPENALDLLVGYHVMNISDLENAIAEVYTGIDKYANERNKLLPLLHTHADGNASKRIIDNLGL